MNGNLQWHAHRVALHPLFPGRIGIWECWFLPEGGIPENPEKDPRSRHKNQHQTRPVQLEPRPHWWEASAIPAHPYTLGYVAGRSVGGWGGRWRWVGRSRARESRKIPRQNHQYAGYPNIPKLKRDVVYFISKISCKQNK